MTESKNKCQSVVPTSSRFFSSFTVIWCVAIKRTRTTVNCVEIGEKTGKLLRTARVIFVDQSVLTNVPERTFSMTWIFVFTQKNYDKRREGVFFFILPLQRRVESRGELNRQLTQERTRRGRHVDAPLAPVAGSPVDWFQQQFGHLLLPGQQQRKWSAICQWRCRILPQRWHLVPSSYGHF